MGKQNRKSKVAAKVKDLQEQEFLEGDYLNGHLMHLKQYPETQPEVYRKEHSHYDRHNTAGYDNKVKRVKRQRQ